jgi:hypothetical protein
MLFSVTVLTSMMATGHAWSLPFGICDGQAPSTHAVSLCVQAFTVSETKAQVT